MSNELKTIDKYCDISKTSLNFKGEITKDQWMNVFTSLKSIEGCVQFWIGDCLKYREQKWGMYDDIVDKTGYDKNTLRQYKNIADSVKSDTRVSDLGYSHHREVSSLPDNKQKEFLNKAKEDNLTVKELREEIRKDKFSSFKPKELPKGKYNVIYADPPWQYEHSKTHTRDIENNYPTMELDKIMFLDIPSDENSVLLLWATAPKIEEAIKVMNAWGFKYRTCSVWDKEIIGMGYWFRGQHELLLVGVKGDFSPPAVTERVSSVYRERRGKHSKKPEYYYKLIEKMFPDCKYLELFARNPKEGWEVWGNEL